jgi:hypothetical protein
MKKEKKAYQPTEEEGADFDYFWQPLRRNFGYCMAVGGIGWNEMCYEQKGCAEMEGGRGGWKIFR